VLEEIAVNEDKRLNSTHGVLEKYDPGSREKKHLSKEETKKGEIKFMIQNPTPSNMDMGVLMTEYVQTKWGKSQ